MDVAVNKLPDSFLLFFGARGYKVNNILLNFFLNGTCKKVVGVALQCLTDFKEAVKAGEALAVFNV